MSDDERKHLEGLDEQTERERWEEFHAADRDDLAAILNAHLLLGFGCCQCGWLAENRFVIPTDQIQTQHRAHVAQMVLESDWLRGVRAKELRDAADAVKEVRDRGLPPSCHSHPTHQYIETWLRDRAAGVGTKDGDDDE